MLRYHQKEPERKLTRKKIFGSSTTKADLKKQIDSLKSLIIQANTTKKRIIKSTSKSGRFSDQFVKRKCKKYCTNVQFLQENGFH